MNETIRNNIEKVCESLTREEAIELCEKLIAENEELKNYIEALLTDYGKVVEYSEELADTIDVILELT